jgi:hypothetical protein
MFRSLRLLIEDHNDELDVFRELFLRFFLLCGDFVIVYGNAWRHPPLHPPQIITLFK